jgi:hypothetical protein
VKIARSRHEVLGNVQRDAMAPQAVGQERGRESLGRAGRLLHPGLDLGDARRESRCCRRRLHPGLDERPLRFRDPHVLSSDIPRQMSS